MVGAVRDAIAVDHQQLTTLGSSLAPLLLARGRHRALPRPGEPLARGRTGAARFFQLYPGRRVVAGAGLAAHLAVDAGRGESLRRQRAQQQMIDAQSGVAWPAVPQIAPIGVERRVGMQRTEGIAPALPE